MSTNSDALVSSLTYHALARVDAQVAEGFRRTYLEPADQSVEGQIRAANEYWRVKLGQVSNAESIQARQALQDADLECWMRLFSTHVVPRLPGLALTF